MWTRVALLLCGARLAVSFAWAPATWRGRGLRPAPPPPPHLRAAASAMEGAQLLHVGVPVTDVDAAAAFFCAVAGMAVQRTDAMGHAFVGFGSEADGEHFALKLTPAAAATNPAVDRVSGASVRVASCADAVAAAEALGAAVVRPLVNVTWVASLVPDEELDAPQPWALRAVVQDAHSGLELELVQLQPSAAAAEVEAAAGPLLRHVTLRVDDLDAAADFFTQRLGMALHRKRSLVPTEPALACWVSYAPSERQGTLLELRYSYGLQHGRGTRRAQATDRPARLGVSAPDVAAAVAELCAPRAATDDADADADSRSSSRSSRSTGNGYGDGDGAAGCCFVVQAVGAVPGVGDEAAVLLAPVPAGLHLVLVDQLDFLKQTLL